MAQPNPDTVRVGEFRRRYENLYRKLSDYYACCSADEVRNWRRVTRILLDEASALKCGQASREDLDAHRQVIAAVTECLAKAGLRIEGYAMKAVARAALQEPSIGLHANDQAKLRSFAKSRVGGEPN
ncbi:hypothetical protein [Pseudomonas azerbaijanorientalis]|jgi:hypothetical protein|uniref:hypothetical protein n=1 Tax=Pseudomonas azerbaijanorientalis TaxID=2842350 RepID=UPI000F7E07F6|nr:hypothetical protein [Pseudomonas azerbaijanorientalis]QXH59449.1 hypothetical protein KSS91_14940 [Pseudomonas azerbaijanorientalis]